MADDAAPRKPRRTWIYVVLGLLAVCVMTMVAVVVGGIMLFNHHIQSTSVGRETAVDELDRAAARFASQTPLLELQDDTLVVHRTPDRPRNEIAALHVLAYDSREGRLMDVTVPGWLLRLAPSGRSSLRVDGVDVLDGRHGDPISLEDLERHGPGLILDGRNRRRGGPVLVWTE